jgi:hypothetical protein
LRLKLARGHLVGPRDGHHLLDARQEHVLLWVAYGSLPDHGNHLALFAVQDQWFKTIGINPLDNRFHLFCGGFYVHNNHHAARSYIKKHNAALASCF